jgi:chromosome segregation ATPase
MNPTPQPSSSAVVPQTNADIALRAAYARASTTRFKSLLDARKAHHELLQGLEDTEDERVEWLIGFMKSDCTPTKNDVKAIDAALSKLNFTLPAVEQLLEDAKQLRYEQVERTNEDLTKKLAGSEKTHDELVRKSGQNQVRLAESERIRGELTKENKQLEQKLTEYENAQKATGMQQIECDELRERLAKVEAQAVESQQMCEAFKNVSGQRVTERVELEIERDGLKKRLPKAGAQAEECKQKCEALESENASLLMQVSASETRIANMDRILQLLSLRNEKTTAAICELCQLLEAKGVDCFDILDRFGSEPTPL